MYSQNAKKKVTKGNFNWGRGSRLFKVLTSFSLGKNHLLYLFKKIPLASLGFRFFPYFSFSLSLFFFILNMSEGVSLASPFPGEVCGGHGPLWPHH